MIAQTSPKVVFSSFPLGGQLATFFILSYLVLADSLCILPSIGEFLALNQPQLLKPEQTLIPASMNNRAQ
ncbi:hypothetical protein IFVP203_C1130298 [Vibrio parahaemolyticus]